MNAPAVTRPQASCSAFALGRRQWLAAAALSALLPAARAASATLPIAGSLADELAVALRHGEPLVVMVSLEGCPFCALARNHYLAPLRAEGRLAIVQVDMRTQRPLKDFQGQPLTHDQMVAAGASKSRRPCCSLGARAWRWPSAWWAVLCRISMVRTSTSDCSRRATPRGADGAMIPSSFGMIPAAEGHSSL